MLLRAEYKPIDRICKKLFKGLQSFVFRVFYMFINPYIYENYYHPFILRLV